MSKSKVTNGEFWKDGQLYVMCGDTAVPIRKTDTSGKEVKPETAEEA